MPGQECATPTVCVKNGDFTVTGDETVCGVFVIQSEHFFNAHTCCEKDFLEKNSVFLLTQRKGVQYFFVLVSGCYDTGVSSSFLNTCMYLCSETLQGYSDSISGRTPPSCGRSSEPRRAA